MKSLFIIGLACGFLAGFGVGIIAQEETTQVVIHGHLYSAHRLHPTTCVTDMECELVSGEPIALRK